MKLIFFGGVQGVGKTTLLSWLKNQHGEQIKFLNPGELFRRYFYNERIKTIEEIEELIVAELEESPADSIIAMHWHYAVRRPSGYIPQISFPRLRKIAEGRKIDQVILFLVEAPADIIRERRLSDQKVKKRELSKSVIDGEIEAEEEFWNTHKVLFSSILGNDKVISLRLVNIDLYTAKIQLFDSVL